MKTLYKNLLIVLSFIIIFCITVIVNYNLFFSNLKSDTISAYVTQVKDDLFLQFSKIEEDAITYNSIAVESDISKIFESGKFKYVEFKYDRFIFKKDMLLSKYINEEETYFINNVKVDFKTGEIIEITDNLFEFKSNIIPAEPNLKLIANVYNMKEQKEFPINISLNKRTIGDENITFEDEKIMNFFTIKDLNIIKVFKIDNISFSQINLFLNGDYIENIYKENFYHQVIMPSFVSSFFIWIMCGFIYVYIMKNIFNPLKKLEEYTKDINNKKSLSTINLNISKKNKIIAAIENNIENIVGSFYKVNNELTISKDIISSFAYTDSKTGFYNYDKLEKHFRKMYLTGEDAFVVYIRFNNIQDIAEKYSPRFLENYILDISNLLKDSINSVDNVEAKIYKLCSSEIVLICKESNQVLINNFLSKVISFFISNLPFQYKITDSILSVGASKFDKYGTINANIKDALKALKTGESKGNNSIFTLNPVEHAKKYAVLKEYIQKEVIQEENFITEILNKTVSSLDNKTCLLETFSPIILDQDKQPLNLGTFFAICEDIGVAMEFDKLHIKKAALLIDGEGVPNYEITLSMQSILDNNFIEWLKEQLELNVNLRRIIFSISATTINHNLERYKVFSKAMKEIGIKLMFKRFNELDFKLDNLEELNLEYVRLSNEITTNISIDFIKQHRCSNIVVACKGIETSVIADIVRNPKDLEKIKHLGIEGEIA